MKTSTRPGSLVRRTGIKGKTGTRPVEPRPILGSRTSSSAAVHSQGEFRILVCGSRDWDGAEDRVQEEIRSAISDRTATLDRDVLVISGGAGGIDTAARVVCTDRMGLAFAEFPAPWKYCGRTAYARTAGPQRNAWMLRWGKPDMVLAFHPYLPGSRGTKHMVGLARAAGVPVRVFDK